MKKLFVSWSEVLDFVASLPQGKVYGVPRGGATILGLALAWIRASRGTKHDFITPVFDPEAADYILDDIVDSGRTRDKFPGKQFIAMFDKSTQPELGWVVFPWEHRDEVRDNEDTVVRQLELIGEDASREGLRDTPKRYLKAIREMTEGYHLKAEEVLGTTFEAAGYDEVVVVKNVEFTSLCEHHLLPFIGNAFVGYLPNDRIVGLSKLARLVDMHSRRLQVQERMTTDIANDIERVLGARGVAVVVDAHHSCMGCRGVRKPAARMVTSAMRGVFREKPEARAEVLGLFDRK